ncbi:YbfB/YjiJ family MFS transporter [Rhodococcus erythropolis]|uniref:YbfB/YjiJ family MFS transporter n=1 Tax=Rhodococcus erythropolis TaxID=1833 RepID=UPI00294A5F28|nr:YbfB/YjiJ family MFS transporter [Rhodococcus erythropolis]MDV6276567.1 YbfB/YjiJ family MFS transporter [Rhodococcus erythropolis]
MTSAPNGVSPRTHAVRAAAALAASMGIGRFVYTPILPLMHTQAGLPASLGATLATANYIGYLIGALAGILIPGVVRSAVVMRTSLVILIATLALMPTTHDGSIWFALRLVAGIASALVFMIAVSALHAHLREKSQHLAGWGFGGVGLGIALSGALVFVIRFIGTWTTAWLASAALAVVSAVVAWGLTPEPRPIIAPDAPETAGPRRAHRWFTTLFISYFLEGIGYIIAGTFLVAAIDLAAPEWVGSGAWIVVGLAAFPSCALWAWLSLRWSRPTLLLVALLIQAIGIALPAVIGGVGPALISAFLFGVTFLGIGSIVLAIGARLQFPRAVALLTAGYSVGQILGPLVVTPLLRDGYRDALLLGSAVVLAVALAAAALRFRFPADLDADPRAATSNEEVVFDVR